MSKSIKMIPMNREESWQVEGVTRAILHQIASLGYTVSVHRTPDHVQMSAIDRSVDPINQHHSWVSVYQPGDIEYRCACLLAEAVGIDLES